MQRWKRDGSKYFATSLKVLLKEPAKEKKARNQFNVEKAKGGKSSKKKERWIVLNATDISGRGKLETDQKILYWGL